METLKKKYGFWTATAMVVGIVIGSGVFFKADDVLLASGGRLPIALLAWLIGGTIMIITSFVFANIATRIERVNGVVDYFEEAYGSRAAYLVAWFFTFIYYPSLVAVLSWVSANYSAGLIGSPNAVIPLSFIFLALFFILNIASPVLAGKLQVSTTLIKLVPLGFIAVIGIISGLISGQTIESFTNSAKTISEGSTGLAVATLSTAFAYEGWIIATTINAELKDSKKTLPKALLLGAFAVVVIYMLYYLGISGTLSNQEVIAAGDEAPVHVISLIFGSLAGTVLTVFVVISCLGTLNGLIMGSARGMFSIAARGRGPFPVFFSRVNPKTNSTAASATVGLFCSAVWLLVWHGNFAGWWCGFLDISELPIAILYVIYISIYVWVMKTFKDLDVFSRFIAPALSGAGSIYIISGAVQKDMFLNFMIIFTLIMIVSLFFMKKKKGVNII
ncbi:MAG: amino acid permease [Spirochaetales bacterium]|nr:amino acid permease [Spirochaetales bacterium]